MLLGHARCPSHTSQLLSFSDPWNRCCCFSPSPRKPMALSTGPRREGSHPSGVSGEMLLQAKVLMITNLNSSSSCLEMHCSSDFKVCFRYSKFFRLDPNWLEMDVNITATVLCLFYSLIKLYFFKTSKTCELAPRSSGLWLIDKTYFL